MQEKIKNVNLEYLGEEERKLARIKKIMDMLKDEIHEEVGDEPEHYEEGDLRSSVWQAWNILNSFFKE